MTKILYRQDNGVVAIISPILTQIHHEKGDGSLWTIDEIASKDVPTVSKYKKVEDSDIPTDRSFRDAWTVDESDLTDGVGA